MRIVIASDHAGFQLKTKIADHLKGASFDILDLGADSDARSDYPDFAKLVAAAIVEKRADRGVLVCGSGIGMCIAANRFSGVRAAVLRDERDAEMSRRHNDANVACLGERFTESDEACRLIALFLSTPFEGGRHEDRVKKIEVEASYGTDGK